MAEFTKGPWFTAERRHNVDIVTQPKGGYEHRVAECMYWTNPERKQPDQSTCAANARLIAAAPDLYEALKVFAAKLEGAIASFGAAEHAIGGPLTDEDAVTVTIGELRRAAAAISRATETEGE